MTTHATVKPDVEPSTTAQLIANVIRELAETHNAFELNIKKMPEPVSATDRAALDAVGSHLGAALERVARVFLQVKF